MVRHDKVREGEEVVALPPDTDAGVYFIGRIATPWTDRLLCPRQGRADGPLCHIEVFSPWDAALDGIAACERLEVLYFMHQARRDLVRQSPRSDGRTRGTFSLRSPVRPNPIATQIVTLVEVSGATLAVRGLDCLDGTPLIDLKPERSGFIPLAPRRPGDDEAG